MKKYLLNLIDKGNDAEKIFNEKAKKLETFLKKTFNEFSQDFLLKIQQIKELQQSRIFKHKEKPYTPAEIFNLLFFDKKKQKLNQIRFQSKTDDSFNQQVKDLYDLNQGQCVICLYNKALYKMQKCHHLVCCEECINIIKKYNTCPLCRQQSSLVLV